MSTKKSVGYFAWTEEKYLHIYHDMADDKYYIETESGRLEIPKTSAINMGQILEECKNK